MRGEKPMTVCKKRRFADHLDAKMKLMDLVQRDQAKHTEPIKCGRCDGWHI